MSRTFGYYIIPDQQMLRPNSGPSEHIHTGLKYLGKSFDIEILAPGKVYEQTEVNEVQSKQAQKVRFGKNGLIGIIRDLKTLLKNHLQLRQYYKALKAKQPDFVYERAEYLNYNGIIACRMLGIPHFYEVNWVFFREMKQYYHSWFNPVSKWLEEWAYNHTNRAFFVGNQNQFLKLKYNNWQVIQNGIAMDTMLKFKDHKHKVEDKIHCCVVAKLMPHHRFDVLAKALQQLEPRKELHFHFIGYEFEKALKTLPEDVSYTFHGPVAKNQLTDLISQSQLGVISGGMHYASFMKLYEYAAVKHLVICPRLQNLENNFSNNEILFFENESAADLA
ncbi:MAG: glycosyltransferase, partial [Bacteroidota bacterium]